MLKSLNEIKELKDPLKQYMVTFTIKESPIVDIANTVGKLINAIGSLGPYHKTAKPKDLSFRAQSFSYPGSTIQQTEVNIGGFKRKIGSIQNKSGVWRCKVIENYDGTIIQLLQNWCDCIHNTELGIRLPSITYSTTCKVTISHKDMTSRSEDKQDRVIYLRGFYPIKYSVDDINPNSSKPVSINIDFNYDFFSYMEHAL